MWKCSLNESEQYMCSSFGSALQRTIPDIICEDCTKWHNSDVGINYMKKFEENRKKEERRIEIEKLKKLAYLT